LQREHHVTVTGDQSTPRKERASTVTRCPVSEALRDIIES
jgi:hypothetical protein